MLLTGGNTKATGFDKRIESELRMLNRVGTPINVVRAYDAQLDAWRGGAWLTKKYFNSKHGLEEVCISRA